MAIVIGAGQSPGVAIGNGRATAVRFLQESASELAVDRDLESAHETIAMVEKSDGEACADDVRDGGSLKAAVDVAPDRWGRVDVQRSNVGVTIMVGDAEVDGITEEVFDRVNSINLRGAAMAANVEPVMRAQRSGVILNVASMSAIETRTQLVTYRTSKAGLIAFTQLLAVRNAEFGVRANAILPGLVDTAMAVDTRARISGRPRADLVAERVAKVPLAGRSGTGWDTADAALFLASDEAGVVTGVSLPVEGGSLARVGF